jgi:hypothetical protein
LSPGRRVDLTHSAALGSDCCATGSQNGFGAADPLASICAASFGGVAGWSAISAFFFGCLYAVILGSCVSAPDRSDGADRVAGM